MRLKRDQSYSNDSIKKWVMNNLKISTNLNLHQTMDRFMIRTLRIHILDQRRTQILSNNRKLSSFQNKTCPN